ncbi:MAG: hypothetical protein J6W75_09645 [Bacteroidaceae bacterium]|nr:hypothetical protein [Bacteroidaceae bacterium]
MNLYIRYFDEEVVVTSVEEALEFIRGIQGFNVTPQFEDDFRQYVEGTMPYPKRYKVRARVYFIVIKTLASSLAEFKANGKGTIGDEVLLPEAESMVEGDFPPSPARTSVRPKELMQLRLNEEMPGWYEGTIYFKRVVRHPETGKCDYRDTTFVARVKAHSALDCYNRIIDHLRTRSDVDPRSQFPSPKGKNYRYIYLGLKPYSEIIV